MKVIDCPFCGRPYLQHVSREKGEYRLKCDACHRMFLLIVKSYLGIIKRYEVFIL
ncbi:MAG: hypothetical protein JW969_15665 [Spirochaetales bacterium]|nr:hypothetical protein [Spirochaetales bacterium]